MIYRAHYGSVAVRVEGFGFGWKRGRSSERASTWRNNHQTEVLASEAIQMLSAPVPTRRGEAKRVSRTNKHSGRDNPVEQNKKRNKQLTVHTRTVYNALLDRKGSLRGNEG